MSSSSISRSSTRVAGRVPRRSQSIQTEVSTKITGHRGAYRAHVVIGIDQIAPDQVTQGTLAAPRAPLPPRQPAPLALRAGLRHAHGFLHLLAAQDHVGTQSLTPRM